MTQAANTPNKRRAFGTGMEVLLHKPRRRLGIVLKASLSKYGRQQSFKKAASTQVALGYC